MSEDLAQLNFLRLKSSSANLRQFTLRIDGEKVAKLGHGVETVTVKPGKYFLQLRIDWERSPKIMINVAPGEMLYFTFKWTRGGGVQFNQVSHDAFEAEIARQ